MRQVSHPIFDYMISEGGSKTRVIFHGYGADSSDLAPLSEALRQSSEEQWIFPNGPLEVPVGPGWTGRAWFPIDVEALERAMATGNYRDMADSQPEGLVQIRDQAISLIEEFCDDPSELIIGGFSQGAMLSLEVALNMTQPPAGLVLWSGALINQNVWREKFAGLKGVPILQSHGSQDPLLDPKSAKTLHQLLKEAGADIEFVGFQGGHEIPMPVLQKTVAFLNQHG